MKVRLGDYIHEYSVKNKTVEKIPVYSVTNTQGFCRDYFGKEVASKNKSTYKIVPKGYFAYNPSRINVGSVDWQRYEEKVIVSPLYNVFSVSPELNQQYLYYYLKSDVTLYFIKAIATGSVRDNLKLDMLYEFPINLPNLEKQEKIVQILDTLQSIITHHNQQLSKLDELVKARFVEMFGNEKQFDLWICGIIEDIADVCVGVVIKPTQYYTDKEKGIRTFRSLNVGCMYIKDSDWVYFTKDGHEKNQKSIIRENDVLVVRSGNPGTACVATSKYAGSNAVDIIIARPDLNKINPVFLAMFTNMPHGMNQISERTGGAAQQHFNVSGYTSLSLIIPPLSLQQQFADFVTQVEKVKSKVKESLDNAQTLFDSLMQEYFG